METSETLQKINSPLLISLSEPGRWTALRFPHPSLLCAVEAGCSVPLGNAQLCHFHSGWSSLKEAACVQVKQGFLGVEESPAEPRVPQQWLKHAAF